MGKLQNLLQFLAWNNTFTSLPKTVGDMKSLIAVDFRHNALTGLPSSVSQWRNIEYLFLAGNPLCSKLSIPGDLKAAKGWCEQQCSVDCNEGFLGNNMCDDSNYNYQFSKKYNSNIKPKANSGCNTAACGYDKGDCLRNAWFTK